MVVRASLEWICFRLVLKVDLENPADAIFRHAFRSQMFINNPHGYDLARLTQETIPRPGYRQKPTAAIRKRLADNVGLIAEGYKQHIKQQTRRIEGFACCVESFKMKREDIRGDIKKFKERARQKQEMLDKVISDIKDKKVSEE